MRLGGGLTVGNVSCYSCRPISVIESPARIGAVGGTFERVGDFGGFWGSLFSWGGSFVKDALPEVVKAGVGLGGTLLLAQMTRRNRPQEQTPRQQVATVNQSSFTLAEGEAKAEQSAQSEKTLNTVLAIAGVAVVGAILLSRRRR